MKPSRDAALTSGRQAHIIGGMENQQQPRKDELPPPKCKAILLCEGTTTESGTGKVNVIGIFNAFTVTRFPGLSHPFQVFFQLAEGFGSYQIALEVHDRREDQLLFRADGIKVEFLDRLNRFNMTIPMPSFPLAHAGVYDLILLANGQEIERQKITATTLGPPPKQKDRSTETEER